MEFHSWGDSSGRQHLHSGGGCPEAEWQQRAAREHVVQQHGHALQLDKRLLPGHKGSNAHFPGTLQGNEHFCDTREREASQTQYLPVMHIAHLRRLDEGQRSAQVAPISDVAFNNLVCAQLPLQPPSGSPASAPSAAPEQIAQPGKSLITKPAPLYVEYAPVVYLQNQDQSGSSWQSDINSLITFLVRSAFLQPSHHSPLSPKCSNAAL